MTKPDAGVHQALNALFDAEREVRLRQRELVATDPTALLDAVILAIGEANAHPDDAERAIRLTSLAALAGELEGPKAIDVLIDILGSDQAEARYTAGIQLEEIAFERWKEVALGVERALDRLPPGHQALGELPYILLELPEPGVDKLLYRFLEHRDAEAVASAIEALVDRGDPSAATRISRLAKDARLIDARDEEEPSGPQITLGELAREAVALLGGTPDPSSRAPARAQARPPSQRDPSGRRGRGT